MGSPAAIRGDQKVIDADFPQLTQVLVVNYVVPQPGQKLTGRLSMLERHILIVGDPDILPKKVCSSVC